MVLVNFLTQVNELLNFTQWNFNSCIFIDNKFSVYIYTNYFIIFKTNILKYIYQNKGGDAQCPTGTTCCQLSSGDYGCWLVLKVIVFFWKFNLILIFFTLLAHYKMQW